MDAQAEGGAWYPESMETWSNAQVVRMEPMWPIATADHQEEIAEQFNASLRKEAASRGTPRLAVWKREEGGAPVVFSSLDIFIFSTCR